MNVLNEQLIRTLENIVPRITNDETVQGVIITSDRMPLNFSFFKFVLYSEP